MNVAKETLVNRGFRASCDSVSAVLVLSALARYSEQVWGTSRYNITLKLTTAVHIEFLGNAVASHVIFYRYSILLV